MFGVAENYQEFHKDGNGFYKRALKAVDDPKYNNEMIYNIACMAIEKFVMSYLGTIKSLPYNHTLTDLAEAMEQHVEMENGFYDTMKKLDSYQMICAFDTYDKKEIDKNAIDEIMYVMKNIKTAIDGKLGGMV